MLTIHVTGDLTHAMVTGGTTSKQFLEEWKAYRDVLTETKVTEKHPWLDIRGNHGQKSTIHCMLICTFALALCACNVCVCVCMCVQQNLSRCTIASD